MPFEPRLFSGDGSPPADLNDLRLPPELRALASRLTCEANDLTSKFPAVRRRSVRWWMMTGPWASGVAAVFIAGCMALCAGLTFHWTAQPTAERAQEGGASHAIQVGPVADHLGQHAPASVVLFESHPPTTSISPSASAAAMTASPDIIPAALFQNLSGAEQEALLDLVDERALQQGSLSL